MRLIVKDRYEDLCHAAARHVADRIAALVSKNGRCVLGLPTGSTPLGVYRELVALHQAGKLSFKDVVTFNMDEYVGLPPDHPQSYRYFMWTKFFSLIDIKRESVHIPDGMAADLTAECAAYEEAIAKAGGIDLFLGGVGPDGHIAFNEPGSSLVSRTRVKTLTMDTRIANARFFDGDISKVPSTALTVGVGTIMDAREVLILVNGQAKARALRDAVEGGVSHMCTLSALQMHPCGIIICDEDATVELKVGTVRYFKDIEARN